MLEGLVGMPTCKSPVRADPSKEGSVRLPASIVIRSGGDCGPDTAAWLLNEHGPALYRSRSPETRETVRQALQRAWRNVLSEDPSGDEMKAFVRQRLDQVPEASEQETLDAQAEATLQALLRQEPETPEPSVATGVDAAGGEAEEVTDCFLTGGTPTPLPYWLLPTDWSRLAEAYQVDFVLHGLPGTENRGCDHCNTRGHVHVGPRDPGIDLCLHVGWQSRRSKSESPTDFCHPADWGHWEPLGSGPIRSENPKKHDESLRGAADGSSTDPTSKVQVFGAAPRPGKETLVEVSEALESHRWALASFNCVQTSAVCGSAPCSCNRCVSVDYACPPRCQHVCPQKMKDCNACAPTESRFEDRPPVEEDGFGSRDQADEPSTITGDTMPGDSQSSPSPTGSDCPPALAALPSLPPLPASQGPSGSPGPGKVGARFCVLVESAWLAAGDADGLARFRDAFAAAIARAACVAPTRVRVLDAGPPLDLDARARRREEPREDNGAGVLAFLGEELTPLDQLPALSPRALGSDAATLRVLAVIREPALGLEASATEGEEPGALAALDKVMAELADPESVLQETLRPWLTEGRPARLWQPEARRTRQPLAGRSAAACAANRLRRARLARSP